MKWPRGLLATHEYTPPKKFAVEYIPWTDSLQFADDGQMNENEVYATAIENLSASIKALRSRQGLSQEQLALVADIDRTFVSQIERGQGNPSVRVIAQLAKALGVSVEDLFTSQDPSPKRRR